MLISMLFLKWLLTLGSQEDAIDAGAACSDHLHESALAKHDPVKTHR